MRGKRWGASALLLVALVTAGCGKDGEQVLAAAGETTADAGSSRMAMTVSAESAPASTGSSVPTPEPLRMEVEGLIDYETGHGIMKMDMGSLAIPGAPQGDAEMRMLGSIVYMKLPGKEMGNRPWIKFDLEALSAAGGAPVPGLNPASNDPRGVLDALRGVSGEVEEIGEENVRGVAATHYRASVDLAKAEKAVPEARRDDFAAFREQLGIKTLPIEVWVDDEGRARRFAYEVDTPETSQAPASQVDLVVDLYDFGVDVEVEAPPESEVTDYGGEAGQPAAQP